MGGFIIPFIFHLYVDDTAHQRYCLIACVITSVPFIFIEMVQIQGYGLCYFLDSVNWIEVILQPLFIAYAYTRLTHPNLKVLPGDLSNYFTDACNVSDDMKDAMNSKELFSCIMETEQYKDYMKAAPLIPQQWISVMILLILFLSFNKLVLYLRVYQRAARVIRLCWKVFFDSSYFMFAFYFFNLLFGLLYYVSGNDIGGHPDDKHG